MGKEELQKLFCTKIGLERELFKRRMLRQKPEDIYGKAYQIDCYINIYEQLLEMSEQFPEEQIKKMLVFPNLLAFFYGRWLKKEDSYEQELRECLEISAKEIQTQYEKSEKEEEMTA